IDWALTRGNDVESGVRIVVGLSACRIAEMNELVEDAGRYSNGIGERTQALLELAQARTALLRHAGSAQSAAETFRRIGERGSEAEALMHCGGEQWRRGNAEDALRRLREALDVAERFAPPRQVADVLNRLGALTAVATPRRTEGREMVERAVAMYESVDDRGRLVWTLVNLAELLFEDGDAAGALERADQALGLARGVGNEYAAIQCQNNLASYAMRSGRIRAAASHVRDALRASAALEAAWLETVAIDRAAEIAAANGSSDVAAKLIGYTDAAFERFGCPRESTEQPDYERALVEIRASLSEDRLAALLATGATLDEPTALKLAMHATEMGDLK
ncbi:MAG TPA: hypothetical protein VNG31_01555, partial [Candidatus Baltobacteraceae bacterium]|nr:hypothetical protein [Candidatus Baltobacteraceae bacterium]